MNRRRHSTAHIILAALCLSPVIAVLASDVWLGSLREFISPDYSAKLTLWFAGLLNPVWSVVYVSVSALAAYVFWKKHMLGVYSVMAVVLFASTLTFVYLLADCRGSAGAGHEMTYRSSR